MKRGEDSNGWKLTSVRWLRDNYPHYVSTRNKPAYELLSDALRRMSYLEADAESTGGDGEVMRNNALDSWDDVSHAEMRSFLAEGGYVERKKELSTRLEIEGASEAITVLEQGMPDHVSEVMKPVENAAPSDQSIDDVVLMHDRAGAW